ncbi:hypothetical protein AT5G60030 [Arabidopsis thaliana]|uniref:Uncharacterized protein n=1 Tax=Arabidopsis thaliana TaxID=3702 RepID=A0A1P8BGK0_ARATH|nr:uncharacterized protein AT5G60030 [Arabidopsis thaliana]ANM70729.1 hypothetical protein AT5G60030 [Arabidopsis thaliana]|eukprot:NP_001332314.1 hypothetical protein AT5G60030 [Arabidopsis thaliana]
MKTVTGRVVSAEPISLSKAAKLLSGFASSDNGASQDVSAYLRRASAAFTELKSFHREIKSKETKPSSDRETKSTETKQSSDAKSERNVIDEFDGRKIRYRNSEAVSVESVYGRERDEKKMKKSKDADVVDEKVKEKLEDEQKSADRKERKKKKSKKNNDEDVVDEKEKLEDEQKSAEIKEKKKNKDEDVVDEKEKEKLEDEQRSGERKKEKKKKRKSDEEIVSEERKSKKKRKSDEEMGSEERKSKKKRKLKEIDD